MVKAKLYFKHVAFLAFCLAMCKLVFWPQPVLASETAPEIEQVQVVLPSVQAYFYAPDKAQVTAPVGTLEGKPLSLETMRKYDPAKDVTSYFFLVDCSTSTTAAQMQAIQTALLNFTENLHENAHVTLISFGIKVDVILERETDKAAITRAVNALAPNQAGTVFFDALAKAIDLAGNKDFAIERKLAFVFSDSVDYNLGGYTKDEIDNLLRATGLPFYAMGFDTGAKEQLDNFGAVARASGGSISIVSSQTLPQTLQDVLAKTNTALVAQFMAENNIISQNIQTFTLAAGDAKKIATMQVPVRAWLPDDVPPIISKVSQISPESLSLVFNTPVQGANLAQSFVVKTENGDLLGIKAAAYDEKTQTVTITFTGLPPSGTFAVEAPGVTDISMEKNKVPAGKSLVFEGTDTKPIPESAPGVAIGAWVFVGIIALLAAAGIVAASARKRNAANTISENQEQLIAESASPKQINVLQNQSQGQEMQVHFVSHSSPLPVIKLHVTGPLGKSTAVEVTINKTLFVGRSNICEVYFDDKTMSRQHFAISEENGSFSITNLSSTSATFLNGVPVAKTRPLYSGDTIAAGQQSLVFFPQESKGEQ